jgi:hypothetical protein
MTKQEYLDIVRLLSALEVLIMSWSKDKPIPDYIYEQLGNVLVKLEKEILK